MSTQATWTPMPEELANLTPPTREDAINTLHRRSPLGTRHIERFEDSRLGEQCGRGLYGTERCLEYRKEFERKREAAIADGMAEATREYERKLARKAEIDKHNAAALEAEIAPLKQRYLEQPGASEAEFEKALPELLEARRRQAALTGQSEQERLVEQMRANVRI